MKESRTTAIAVVTVTLSIELKQPWGAESTLEQVQKQARQEALERVGAVAGDLAKIDARVGEIRSIRIVLNEERMP